MHKKFDINYVFLLIPFLFITSAGCTLKSQEESKEEASVIIDSLKELSILCAGDVMGHDRQILSAYDEFSGTYDYSHNYKYVAPIIRSVDIAVVNLEVTLPGEPPYAGYPEFRSPDALAAGLKYAGFNTIVTANNHSNDAYGQGLINTLDVLKSLSLYHTGTFRDLNERDSLYPLIIEKNDFKIALLNYTYGTNAIADTPPTFVNRTDTVLIKEDVNKAKELKADLIIAYMHWGIEYELFESQTQKALAQFLANSGVNLIIGSHPHVIQPVRYIKNSNNDNIICAYSLGNFISNQLRLNTDGGMMFEVRYKKNIFTGEVQMVDFSHQLVWRYRKARSKKYPHGQFFLIPIAEYEAGLIDGIELPQAKYDKMCEFATRMRLFLNENSVSEEKSNLISYSK